VRHARRPVERRIHTSTATVAVLPERTKSRSDRRQGPADRRVTGPGWSQASTRPTRPLHHSHTQRPGGDPGREEPAQSRLKPCPCCARAAGGAKQSA
jgi:hypothetical protein